MTRGGALTAIILAADGLVLSGGRLDVSAYELARYCDNRKLALIAVCHSASTLRALENSHIPRLQLIRIQNVTRPEREIERILRSRDIFPQSVVFIGATEDAQRLAATLLVPFFSVVRAGPMGSGRIGPALMASTLRHIDIFYSKSRLWSYASQSDPVAGEHALLLNLRLLEVLAPPLYLEAAAVALDDRHPLASFYLEHLFSSLVLGGYARRADVWTVMTRGDGSDVLEQFALERSAHFDAEVVPRLPEHPMLETGRFLDQKVLMLDYHADKESRARIRQHLYIQGADEVLSVSLCGDGGIEGDIPSVAKLSDELLVSLTAYRNEAENRRDIAGDASLDDDERRATWAEVNSHDPRFANKYLGWMAREEGTFGSVTLYDDYGDEGNA